MRLNDNLMKMGIRVKMIDDFEMIFAIDATDTQNVIEQEMGIFFKIS